MALQFTTAADKQGSTQVAKKKSLKPLEQQVKHLEEVITGIRKDDAWMSGKMQRMREVNDSTASRVLLFSIFSIIILVSSSVLQIWYLKRYFKAKKLVD